MGVGGGGGAGGGCEGGGVERGGGVCQQGLAIAQQQLVHPKQQDLLGARLLPVQRNKRAGTTEGEAQEGCVCT
jgi:hypothetical protein